MVVMTHPSLAAYEPHDPVVSYLTFSPRVHLVSHAFFRFWSCSERQYVCWIEAFDSYHWREREFWIKLNGEAFIRFCVRVR